jgi:isopentenyl diphosphate isomerase/L-lactate dehydrogenase-like FMN-dependent dehydrogenase
VKYSSQFESYPQLEEAARRRLPRTLFKTIMTGAGRGVSADWNVEAFDQVAFQPRSGACPPIRELHTTVLGSDISLPVILAPVGALRLINPQGAVAAARAAEAAGTVCAVSAVSGHTADQVAARTSGVLWQQITLSRGKEAAEIGISAAARSGCNGLVVTIDSPVSSKKGIDLSVSWRTAWRFGPELIARPRWSAAFVRDGASLKSVERALTSEGGRPVAWSDLEWIRERWHGALIVKGILRADDARRAAGEGADAVVVSNHGGLTLDGVPATLSALPSVVRAVGGSVEILLDGGVRQGADVVRALALGAKAVLIGRAYVAGLAVGGESGVRGVIEMFREQIDVTLALLGCPSVSEMDRSFVLSPASWDSTES